MAKTCKECDCCRKGYFKSEQNAYVCIGVKNPFVIADINKPCTEYGEPKRSDSMKVEIVKKQEVELEEYWVIRGIKDTGTKKEVVAEHKMPVEPNSLAIAQFLVNNPKADFCAVSHNYELV